MAKRASKADATAKPKKRSKPEADSQKPKDSARSNTGRVTEEQFAAARARPGCKNNEEAAIAIGLAASYGKILSARPGMKERIAAVRLWHADMLKMNGAQLLMEAWFLARSDISEVVIRKGNRLILRDDSDIPWFANKAIRKLTCKTEERVQRLTKEEEAMGLEPAVLLKQEISVEMHDKSGAQNLISKHLPELLEKSPEGDGKKTWLDFMRMCVTDGPA